MRLHHLCLLSWKSCSDNIIMSWHINIAFWSVAHVSWTWRTFLHSGVSHRHHGHVPTLWVQHGQSSINWMWFPQWERSHGWLGNAGCAHKINWFNCCCSNSSTSWVKTDNAVKAIHCKLAECQGAQSYCLICTFPCLCVYVCTCYSHWLSVLSNQFLENEV